MSINIWIEQIKLTAKAKGLEAQKRYELEGLKRVRDCLLKQV